MIEFDKFQGKFIASAGEPYAPRLAKAGWERKGQTYVTDDLIMVVDFIDELSPELYALVAATRAQVQESQKMEASPDFQVPLPESKKLYPFQEAAIEFISKRDSTLLAEEAGLGKTPICIGACNYFNAKSILIICPATAKYNWADNEWPRWTTFPHLTVGVVEGDAWVDTDVVVINYDILDRHLAKLHQRNWDILIADESHKLKNQDSKRTRVVFGGREKIDAELASLIGAKLAPGVKTIYYIPEIRAERRIFATATPMNRPKDLWTTIKACDPHGLGKSQRYFEDRYCEAYRTPYGWNKNGAANLKELGALMRANFMVRHPFNDLPPLTEQVFLLPEVKVVMDEEESFVQDNIEALTRISKEAGVKEPTTTREWMLLLGETLLENSDYIAGPDYRPLFTAFALMRKKTGIAKLPYVIDFLRDKTDDGASPAVVFGYHKEVMAGLREAFPDHAHVIGGMPAKKRMEMCKRFQEGEVNWFFGNIHAAGEIITLTRATYLAFAEMDWQGTAMIQARKRIHRLTQDHPCLVDYLCANKSFDALIYDTAIEKMNNIAETMEL